MGLNVKNIKLNSIYKFDDGKYITIRVTNKTANGIRINKGPKELVFVYEVENGSIINVISGRIVDKMEEYDINKEFMIIEYDSEKPYTYQINKPLEEVTLIEALRLKKMIVMYNHRNNINGEIDWESVLNYQTSEENYTVDGNDGINWEEVLKADSDSRKKNHYDNDGIDWSKYLDEMGETTSIKNK